jgi:hypothetical protein
LTIDGGGECEAAENSPNFQASERETELMILFYFFQTHFPEEDGFEHTMGPFYREVCYAQHESGEEVVVTIPPEDTKLRKRALEIPLALFQSCFPKEDGFDHHDAGPLERDVHYTELTDGGEGVTVTTPWENTRMYMAIDKNRARIIGFALYVLPPVAVASSEPKNAEML